jgi:hypothetical protein
MEMKARKIANGEQRLTKKERPIAPFPSSLRRANRSLWTRDNVRERESERESERERERDGRTSRNSKSSASTDSPSLVFAFSLGPPNWDIDSDSDAIGHRHVHKKVEDLICGRPLICTFLSEYVLRPSGKVFVCFCGF